MNTLMPVDLRSEYEAWLVSEARTWAKANREEAETLAAEVTAQMAPPLKYSQLSEWPAFMLEVRKHAIAEAVRKRTNGPTLDQWWRNRS